MLAAGAAALLFQRLRQPKVVGYILAGLLLGPHTWAFPLIRDEESIRLLADLGVVFLMFSVGLEFNLRRLRKLGPTIGITALMDVAVLFGLGYGLGRALHWTVVESLFLGGIICDSSTTILARTLQELGRTREKFASLAIGITLIEDVLAIVMIAVLTGVAVTGAWQAGLVFNQLWVLVIFLTVVTVGGLLTLPRLLNYVHRFENEEVLLLVLLGIGCSVSMAAESLRLSMALGAVLVGALASESLAAPRINAMMEPLRHMFGAVFFVAVGLMLDPAMLLRYGGPILAVTALILAGKFSTNTLGSLLTGHDLPTAVRVGGSMAQVGEFAFIIAALGVSLHATREPVYQVGVGAAVLSICCSAPLLLAADRLATLVEGSPRGRRWTALFHFYGQWADRIGRFRPASAVGRAVRRALILIAGSVLLICSVIASAGYLAQQAPAQLPFLPARPGLVAVLLWICAMIVCLPLYATILGKLLGLGMLLAELAIPPNLNAPWARAARNFVTNAILVAGAIGLLVLTFVLSATMLPSPELLLLLMAATLATGYWSWRRLARVYRQARTALENMLDSSTSDHASAERLPHPPPPSTPGPTELGLHLVDTLIPAGGAVIGKEVRTLYLRRRTGVTLVGIQRAGQRLVNPAPSERLQAGDQLLLLGEPEQLQRACQLLARRPP
jgi:CPA2 family monovalent cation:H+ antiporter-2